MCRGLKAKLLAKLGKINQMKKYLYFNVFIAGLTTIATEFVASRSLQNIYGASNFVWATIIGLIMIYFALGYHFGGRFAERTDSMVGMLRLQILAAGLLSVIPIFSNVVLAKGAIAFDQINLPAMVGAFISVIILYSVPVIILAMTTPIVIRQLHSLGKKVGEVAGNVNSISTLGSVLGAFIPTLWLFGTFGTAKSMQLIAAIMLVTSLIGLYLIQNQIRYLWIIAITILLEVFILGLDFPIKNTPGQVFETESAYNYIEVVQVDEDVLLRLNEGQGYHSQYNPNTNYYAGPWELFLLAPLFSEMQDPLSIDHILVVGMAAGTTLTQAAIIYPDAALTGIELDPEIIEVGIQYFNLNPARHNIIVGDGRYELGRIQDKQDLIIVDAYTPPYIPPHLVTKEFFEICKSKLDHGGIIAINVGRMPDDRSLINDLATTINTEFEHLVIADLPETFNTIIFASNDPLKIENLTRNYLGLDPKDPGEWLLIVTAQNIFNGLRSDFEEGSIYSDDLSRIEWVTNRMIFNFLLSQ